MRVSNGEESKVLGGEIVESKSVDNDSVTGESVECLVECMSIVRRQITGIYFTSVGYYPFRGC